MCLSFVIFYFIAFTNSILVLLSADLTFGKIKKSHSDVPSLEYCSPSSHMFTEYLQNIFLRNLIDSLTFEPLGCPFTEWCNGYQCLTVEFSITSSSNLMNSNAKGSSFEQKPSSISIIPCLLSTIFIHLIPLFSTMGSSPGELSEELVT